MSQTKAVPEYVSNFLSTRSASPVALSRSDLAATLETLFGLGEDAWHPETIVHPDISYFAPDDGEWKVEEVRSKIIARSSIAPEWPYQAIIIDRADQMSVASANALLKVLEDTPKNTLFILLVRSRLALLPTVLSRIRVVSLDSLPGTELSDAERETVRGILRKDSASIAKFLSTKSFEREVAAAFLTAFRSEAVSGGFVLPADWFETFSDAFTTVLSTNATAKYQIDRVVLAYLGRP